MLSSFGGTGTDWRAGIESHRSHLGVAPLCPCRRLLEVSAFSLRASEGASAADKFISCNTLLDRSSQDAKPWPAELPSLLSAPQAVGRQIACTWVGANSKLEEISEAEGREKLDRTGVGEAGGSRRGCFWPARKSSSERKIGGYRASSVDTLPSVNSGLVRDLPLKQREPRTEYLFGGARRISGVEVNYVDVSRRPRAGASMQKIPNGVSDGTGREIRVGQTAGAHRHQNFEEPRRCSHDLLKHALVTTVITFVHSRSVQRISAQLRALERARSGNRQAVCRNAFLGSAITG